MGQSVIDGVDNDWPSWHIGRLTAALIGPPAWARGLCRSYLPCEMHTRLIARHPGTTAAAAATATLPRLENAWQA